MIVKRKPKPVRAIVKRRGTAVVGEKRGTIVKRIRGGGVVPPVAPPPKEPREWHFPKRWLWLGATVVTLAVIVGGGTWLYQSSVFRVTDIQVVGAKRTSADSVVETANLLGDEHVQCGPRAGAEGPLQAAARGLGEGRARMAEHREGDDRRAEAVGHVGAGRRRLRDRSRGRGAGPGLGRTRTCR